MVCLSFLHYTSLCISCDKNLGEVLMLCFVLWALCCSFLSINIYVCTWVDLLFVNNYKPPSGLTSDDLNVLCFPYLLMFGKNVAFINIGHILLVKYKVPLKEKQWLICSSKYLSSLFQGLIVLVIEGLLWTFIKWLNIVLLEHICPLKVHQKRSDYSLPLFF
jgi:hypothetical protein